MTAIDDLLAGILALITGNAALAGPVIGLLAFAESLIRPAELNDWLALHTRHPERSTLDTLAHSISVDTLRGFAAQWAQLHQGAAA